MVQHLLNKLEFELECPTEEQAFEIRRTFSASNQEQIIGIIDNICTKHAGENDWFRIDKLEINLGEFSLESFEHEFTRIFINKFDAIVAEKISQVPKKERAELRLTSDLELIKYFLLNGRLPWWGDEAGLAFEELIRGIFKNRLAEISDFFKENYNNNAVWERASYQFNDEILGVIIQLFVELKDAQKLLEEVLEKASS